MDLQKVLETIIKTIMDCLEECFNSMTMATGKRLLEVCGVCGGFLVVSIVLRIFKLPAFISWQEASLSCLIVLGILSIDYVNKASIDKVKERLNKVKRGGKDNG